MANTRIEAVLLGIGDGAKLEQLATDLLEREGYDVDPTGTRGPDGGRDALIYREDERGILHCSISSDLEDKLNDDAEKAAARDEDYEFFIFVTTQNPAAVKRDRLEDEIHDEYGWRTEILDLQRLRNRLQGNVENHDLVRDHLHINPKHAFEDPKEKADEFYQSQISQLQDREGYHGTLASTHPLTDHKRIPILTVHIIPAEAFGGDHDRLGSELLDPPGFGGFTQQYGDYVLTGDNNEEPYRHYACFHEDGWAEAITTDIITKTDDQELTTVIDKYIVEFIEDALNWYEDVGINPPFYTYLTLLDAGDYAFYVPNDIWTPDTHREIGDDVFKFGDVTIDSYDADVPDTLRKPMYRLWSRAGWPRSLNYTEVEENDEIRYEWDPRG